MEIPVTGPMIMKKAKSFYNEMKITDKWTFSDGQLEVTKNYAVFDNLAPVQFCHHHSKGILLYMFHSKVITYQLKE